MLFTRLGDTLMWQDEAQTALVAQTIPAHGIPLGFDGKNYFTQTGGRDMGAGLVWKYHPWLPFYLCAVSLACFGKSTLAARLPFAFLGLATILLLYGFALRLYQRRVIGWIAAGLLTFSIPFILLARQCRYYSPATLFSLLALFAYADWKEKKSRWLFILAAVLLFYTHQLYCAVVVATVLSHSLIFQRDQWRSVLSAILAVVGFLLPGIWWHFGISYGALYPLGYSHPNVALQRFTLFMRDIERDLFRWFLIPLGLVAGWTTYKEENRSQDALLLIFSLAMISGLCLATPDYFFRYLAPLIPILCLITARIVETVSRVNRWAGMGLVIGILMCQPIKNYAYELTHHYSGPMDGYVDYLNRHAKSQDVVLITYEDLPLKFYTPLKVIGGLAGDDLSRYPHPEWVIMRRHTVCADDAAVGKYIIAHMDRKLYDPIVLPYPDCALENREDLEHHLFRTATDEKPIVLFHRR